MTVHTKISYLKSAIRIIGYGLLFTAVFPSASSALFGSGCIILMLAEVLGIVEELPGAYKGTKTS